MITRLLIAFLCAYSLFLSYVIIRTATFSTRIKTKGGVMAAVSIIIPFKNEAPNLSGLLASLSKQDFSYPWEIILVNDNSTDDYKGVLGPWNKRLGNKLRVIDSFFDPALGLTSKQQALDAGVSASSFDCIVFTDADMTFDKSWLSLMAASLAQSNDFIVGRTATLSNKPAPFLAMQRFQLDFLFATAFSFHASGLESSCMGNNIAFRKYIYDEIGGQKGIGHSIVEDRALYLAVKRKRHSIATTDPFDAMAFTLPCSTAGGFFHQMLRWSRGGFSFESSLLPIALLFSFQNCMLALSLSGIFKGSVAILSYVNFCMTILFVFISFSKIKARENMFLFPLFLLFLLCETIVFVASFITTRRVVWKNKKV